MYSLVLLAGGSGSRMKKSTPKQYLLLAGKPIIMHTIERIDRIEDFKEIIIVCTKEYQQVISDMIRKYAIKLPVRYAEAGKTRQESVKMGAELVKTDYVVIHEAARPFVSEQDFRELLEQPEDNVMYGIHIPFTVLKGHEYVEELLDRSELINVQLPQKFLTKDLVDSHYEAEKNQEFFTEDAGMVFKYQNAHVKILKGKEYNIKITTTMDLITGEQIYKEYFARRK